MSRAAAHCRSRLSGGICSSRKAAEAALCALPNSSLSVGVWDGLLVKVYGSGRSMSQTEVTMLDRVRRCTSAKRPSSFASYSTWTCVVLSMRLTAPTRPGSGLAGVTPSTAAGASSCRSTCAAVRCTCGSSTWRRSTRYLCSVSERLFPLPRVTRSPRASSWAGSVFAVRMKSHTALIPSSSPIICLYVCPALAMLLNSCRAFILSPSDTDSLRRISATTGSPPPSMYSTRNLCPLAAPTNTEMACRASPTGPPDMFVVRR
mmetsp:Transcript_3862/g.8730  ORF Transcript_3862/g.8730 Transcript_3862/m.8730 type:complete len:261 (-) Transcript_3862:323-1105(-)